VLTRAVLGVPGSQGDRLLLIVMEEDDGAVLAPEVEALLDRFWHIHNPTTKNRQGLDFGSQYRSVIFFHDDEQKAAALASRDALDRSGEHRKKIVTEILPAPEFWRAEEYHQHYYDKNGISACRF